MAKSVHKFDRDFLYLVTEKVNENIEDVLYYLGFDIEQLWGTEYEIRCSCPIHKGDNNTAFSYSKSHKKWRCFTNNCHEGRDSIFGLVEQVLVKKYDRPVGFIECVDWICALLKIDTDQPADVSFDFETFETRRQNKYSNIINRIRDKNNADHKYFRTFDINKLPKIHPSSFFLKQGFTAQTLRKFMVGTCTDETKPLYNRSFVPVLSDEGDQVIGFTGRTIYPQCPLCNLYHPQGNGCPSDNYKIRSCPKWFHYGFKTNQSLYNLCNAKQSIIDSGICILTEGTKDVWWFDQNNIFNSMCIFGLNLSDKHIYKLSGIKNLVTVVLALDNDTRGHEASKKIQRKLENKYSFNVKTLYDFMDDKKDIAELSVEKMELVRQHLGKIGIIQ